MDYKPENDFYGNAPQKPFTEKNDYSQPAQRYVPQQQAFTPQPSNQPFEPPVPPQDFNPEKPLMPKEPQQNQPVEIPAVEMPQSEQFNPVQHTAVYQNGAFVTPEPPRFPQNAYGQPQPPYPPQGYYPQPVQQNIYAHPEQQNVYAQPEQQNVYAQPKPPKQKSNKGLIAVIIVLSVLLAGSLAGILVYVLHNGSQQTAKNDDSVNGFHEFTLPDNGNGGGFFQQETTAPVVNDQSDYSDKIIPDYSGMKLEKKPSDAEKNTEYGSEYAFKSVSESVVGIMAYSDKDKTQLKSQGSGIIISQGGYLITNAHVIGNSKTAYAISVITSDGKEYNAGVVGFDSRTDLAVLKMDDAENLKPATFGDSGDLTLGEDIIIVGNPGGISYQNSMTKGVVSALDRDASNKSIVKFIQIPTATVKEIVDSLVKNGYVEGRVKIGIVGTAVDLETATYNNVPQGIYVDQVDKDGPCGGTKLAEGDIVTALDGETITNFSEIYNVLEKHKDGDKVTLKYYQASTGKEVEEEITLAADK